MAQRISPVAAYGSLLKVESAARTKGKKKFGRPSEVKRDVDYLALVRRCPCISCDQDPAGIAAHVRMTRAGKPIAGTGIKPGDQWTLPLCATCHTDGVNAQHKIGEVQFWSDVGINPLVICARLYSAAPDIEAMRRVCFKAREGRS